MSLNSTETNDKTWFYHAYSIWLFTRSDLKTIVFPQAIFGIITAVAMHTAQGDAVPWARVLTRSPRVIFWVWMNLLPFTIDNQRRPASIMEDKHNKPWRPMPSGRMTEAQAKTVMLVFYPLAIGTSLRLGGLMQSLALIAMGYGYNDLNLADWHWTSRNAINALGFCSFASGALDVTLGSSHLDLPLDVVGWLCIIAGVVFTTVQTQDMADQIGDRLRGRSSLPLVVGDAQARWLTALPMVAWSFICPRYWRINDGLEIFMGLFGVAISCGLLIYRSIEADKQTFRLWNVRMAGLYVLPVWAATSNGW
ncbi:UbiA prenyltransferase family-domain-containing protein [Astrocystis sublimbata]|nr:UbiA prenyltransferase family-domain-containing protein [Astrocystis sublimbata]